MSGQSHLPEGGQSDSVVKSSCDSQLSELPAEAIVAKSKITMSNANEAKVQNEAYQEEDSIDEICNDHELSVLDLEHLTEGDCLILKSIKNYLNEYFVMFDSKIDP